MNNGSRYFIHIILASHTLRLTYIPYFRTDEIDENDMRAYTNMNEYVTMPGVVYSDRVIVQSEGIRELYIKSLQNSLGKKQDPNGQLR